MTDKLREEIARAICERRYHEAGFPDSDDPNVTQKYWCHYTGDADVVLPIHQREIARARADALEEAAKVARVGWLTSKRQIVGDADREDALCEEIAAAIRALSKRGDGQS